VGIDLLEQFDYGGGGELDASGMVEPDSGTGKAEIHAHRAMIVLFKILDLHRLLTVRAGDRRKRIYVGHGVATRQGVRGNGPMRRINHPHTQRTLHVG